jgi:uncharacterized integral membrane protein
MTQAMQASSDSIVYQGQFGEFTITDHDRRGVLFYRTGLMVAAIAFAAGTALMCWQPQIHWAVQALTPLFTVFYLSLGISLLTIHIYLEPLHRALQAFWVIGGVAALAIGHLHPEPFALTVYQQPLTVLGVGFTFAALTGIYFKEAFCFNRLETKLLTLIVPLLLLGHLTQVLPLAVERALLVIWAGLFLVFALRKAVQPIPPDIGDKSVFDYLHQQRHNSTEA